MLGNFDKLVTRQTRTKDHVRKVDFRTLTTLQFVRLSFKTILEVSPKFPRVCFAHTAVFPHTPGRLIHSSVTDDGMVEVATTTAVVVPVLGVGGVGRGTRQQLMSNFLHSSPDISSGVGIEKHFQNGVRGVAAKYLPDYND